MTLPAYPAYKDSGVEWLGEVPAHWEVRRIRFVAKLNPSKTEVGSFDGDTEVSFLPMEAIGEDGQINLERTRPLRELESGYTYMRDGDVTLAKITPCFENGKGALMSGLVNGVAFGTTELIVTRPFPERAVARFLHWLFVSRPFRKLGEAAMYGAGGQKRVPDDFVRNFASGFPLPPEQAAIATFLDRETAKIDALVAEQQRLIGLLVEKRRATVSHAVTKGLDPNAPMKDSGIAWLGEVPAHWEVTPLRRFLLQIEQGWSPQTEGRPAEADEYGLIKLSAISGGGFVPDESKAFEAGTVPDFRFEVKALDFLLTRANTPNLVGECCVVAAGTRGGLMLPDLVYRLSTSAAVDRDFLCFILRGTLGRFQISRDARGSSMTMAKISQEHIKDWLLVLPPIDEQHDIVAHLDRVTADLDALTAEASRAVALLKERRAALISAAVTGKIDVRGFSEEAA